MTPDELKARGLRVKPRMDWENWSEVGCLALPRYIILVPDDDLNKHLTEYELCYAWKVISRHPTLEAAKAAAEADNAARIAAQVEVDG